MRYVVPAWNSNGLLSRFEQHAFLAQRREHGSRNTGPDPMKPLLAQG